VEEVEASRRGLMELAHNVVLLRCPDSDKEFTPVSPQPSPSQHAAPSNTPVHSSRKLAPLLWCLISCPAQGSTPY
jgi:hypothetical protein